MNWKESKCSGGGYFLWQEDEGDGKHGNSSFIGKKKKEREVRRRKVAGREKRVLGKVKRKGKRKGKVEREWDALRSSGKRESLKEGDISLIPNQSLRCRGRTK